MLNNLYEIDSFRPKISGRPAACYCRAGQVGNDLFTQELNELKQEFLSPRVLRLENLERKISGTWDFIYSTGLLSGLPQVAARQVVRLAASHLNPGGRLTFANVCLDGVQPCERCAHAALQYRTEWEMAELTRDIPDAQIDAQLVYRDRPGLNVYLELQRTGGCSVRVINPAVQQHRRHHRHTG